MPVPKPVAGARAPAPALRISALTAAQIPQVDCHPEIAGIQPPPLLPQVLDLHKGSPVHLNLEFKVGTADNVRMYMAELAQYQAACGNCLTGRLIIPIPGGWSSWPSPPQFRLQPGCRMKQVVSTLEKASMRMGDGPKLIRLIAPEGSS